MSDKQKSILKTFAPGIPGIILFIGFILYTIKNHPDELLSGWLIIVWTLRIVIHVASIVSFPPEERNDDCLEGGYDDKMS